MFTKALYNQVIRLKWLMSSPKGQILRENPSLILGWSNYWLDLPPGRNPDYQGPFPLRPGELTPTRKALYLSQLFFIEISEL